MNGKVKVGKITVFKVIVLIFGILLFCLLFSFQILPIQEKLIDMYTQKKELKYELIFKGKQAILCIKYTNRIKYIELTFYSMVKDFSLNNYQERTTYLLFVSDQYRIFVDERVWNKIEKN